MVTRPSEVREGVSAGAGPSRASTATSCSARCSSFDRLLSDTVSPLLLSSSSSSEKPASSSHRSSDAMPEQLLSRGTMLPNMRCLRRPPLPQPATLLASRAAASPIAPLTARLATVCQLPAPVHAHAPLRAPSKRTASAIQAHSERSKGSRRPRSGTENHRSIQSRSSRRGS